MYNKIYEEFEEKRVVLVGQTGHGKTTVFNKCCNKNLDVAAGGDSVTRNAFSTHTAYGDGFLMLDTPGIGALKEKLKHAVGIASAFAEGEINMVLIVVRYQRIDVIKQILYPMLKKQFKKFLNICTLAITHWDIVTQDIKNRDPNNLKAVEDKAKSQLDDLIKHFNINHYILISRQDKGDKICKDIEVILNKGYPGIKCGLSTSEIQSYFDILEFTDELNDKLEESKEAVIKKFRKIASVVSIYISKFDMKDPLMPDVMHAISKEIKDRAIQTIEKFEQDNFETFSELENHIEDKSLVYLLDAQLKNELINDINYVIKLSQEKMKNNPLHCFNFIRKCPKCNEVWMKVDGCNGRTFCGNFPQRDEQFLEEQKVIKQIEFDITDNNVIMHYKQQKLETNNKQYSIGCYRYQEIGCRYECDWDDYQLLSKAELDNLLDSGVLDFLADSISEEKFLQNKNLSTSIEQLRKQIKIQQI